MKYTEQDVLDNMGLVYMVAHSGKKRWTNHLIHFEDLISEGTLGLIHALERFDPAKGYEFSTYASKCIRGSILQGHRTLFRQEWKARKRGEFIKVIEATPLMGAAGDEELEVGIGMNDHGENAEAMFDSAHRSIVLGKIEGFLTPRQNEVFRLMILEGRTQHAAGKLLEIGRACISYHVLTIIERITRRFGYRETTEC